MVEFERLTPSIGAVVRGIDLAHPISEELCAQLHDALSQHLVLVFRNQSHISPADHLSLAACFGTPVVHPAYPTVTDHPSVNILESTRERPTKIDSWHTDMTFLECPPLGSVLRAITLPESGGDTLFASLHGAWDSLSDRMQRYLDGLEAVHSFTQGFRESLAEPGGYERLADAVRENPPVRHPVVRTHPLSGRRGLFVNRLFTTGFVGVSPTESRAVLEFLYEHLESPEFFFRVRWRPGTLVFWDNRSSLHRPVNDYWPATRHMHRVTIAGDRPR